jgi:hypothetical protein
MNCGLTIVIIGTIVISAREQRFVRGTRLEKAKNAKSSIKAPCVWHSFWIC